MRREQLIPDFDLLEKFDYFQKMFSCLKPGERNSTLTDKYFEFLFIFNMAAMNMLFNKFSKKYANGVTT